MNHFLVTVALLVMGVELTHPVHLTVSPAANVALGKNATYTCSTSEEDHAVNWFINNQLARVVNSSYVFVDNAAGVESLSMLIVTAVPELNQSIIVCFLIPGSSSENLTLLIQGQPDPPTNLTVSYIGICCAQLSWLPSFTLEDVPLVYDVVINDIQTGMTVMSESVMDPSYIFSPKNLNAQYAVKVAARNDVGPSKPIMSTVSFSGAVNTSISNFRSNGSVWRFDYNLEESCESGNAVGATVTFCLSAKQQQDACSIVNVNEMDIQQLNGGGIKVPVTALLPQDEVFNTSISVCYEGGQNIVSSSDSQIRTFDKSDFSIKSITSDGKVCLARDHTMDGDSFYAIYIEFRDTNNEMVKNITELSNSSVVCLEDLNAGKYTIFYGKVNAIYMLDEVEIPIPNIHPTESNHVTEETEMLTSSSPTECTGEGTPIGVWAGMSVLSVLLMSHW